MSYPFVKAGAPDYGVRKGPTLALMFHMAEGGGTVGYLSRNPPRGVSVHAVCDTRGIVTQMLGWERASGSLNPADRSSDKLYFGHKHLVDVLGRWWTDPNSVVLSMEIEGFAAQGPKPGQVLAAIAWGLDMRAMFPSLRGALGHADQTNTKHCPGSTAAMQQVFDGVGGHGLWHPQSAPQEDPLTLPTINQETRNLVDLHVGEELLDLNGKPLVPVSVRQTQESPMSLKLNGRTYYLVSVVTGGVNTLALLHATPLANARPVPGPVVSGDCGDKVTAERDRMRQAAIDAATALK